jgi:tRNA/rRNA methyltransferase
MTRPVIILVRPQLADNIGAVARVMSNFGFGELRIVAPRKGWPQPKAYAVAANGAFIFDNVVVKDTLSEAITDINYLYATAGNTRSMIKAVETPRQIMSEVKSTPGKTAILFGSERIGLTNEEINLAEKVIQIPTSELNPSLNLAQAVAVFCYEFNSAYKLDIKLPEVAPKAELEYMLNVLFQMIDDKRFFKNPKMKPEICKNITNIFSRGMLTSQ